MEMQLFDEKELKKLYCFGKDSRKGENGQVVIIGGSSLFHGAPILAAKVASRIVDMVFFASPEPSLASIEMNAKSKLCSFIWVPFAQVGDYIAKSDAVLIGPGFMRYRSESKNEECKKNRLCDREGENTKKITEELLAKYPDKQWVIDGGSLQVMDKEAIPKKAILTPNRREFEMIFGSKIEEGKEDMVAKLAKKHDCTIVFKAAETIVCSPEGCVLVKGGNAGLTKGGTGDVLAGLTVALAAKNPPFLVACAASYVLKKAADELHKKVGFAYNADDLANKIPEILGKYFC